MPARGSAGRPKEKDALVSSRRVFLYPRGQPLKRKIKITLEYEGGKYQGWQVQPTGPTIQSVLQETLSQITQGKTTVIGSGRTDSGVHAEAQVAHFVTDRNLTERQFLMALNSLLPRDIVVTRVQEMRADFHAQISALKKIYRFTILNRPYPSALHYRRSWFMQFPLDVFAMQKAAQILVGEHDFSAFRASNCEARNPVRKIIRIDIERQDDFIQTWIEGTGFLKYMVRNIVGTLVQVGRGKWDSEKVREILDSRDRKQAGPTAQPQGLTLVQVFYPEETETEVSKISEGEGATEF
jgi:tRNA pseudouridine38-40 synthase